MTEYFVTQQRLEELKAELELYRTVKRREIADRLREAKDFGDLSENSAYEEARMDQERVELRIAELEDMVKKAKIIKHQASDIVTIGSTITVKKNGTTIQYEIVGSDEAQPEAGKISNESPLGKAFLGKKVGDTVTITTPSGSVEYAIAKIV
jgi:transcription elongation factor GreA